MALLQFWEAKPVRIEVIPKSAQLKVLVCEHKYYQDILRPQHQQALK